jgi:uncharacterized protein YgiM (DUF1202 family)
MKRFFILALVAILLLACSLSTNGATMSAAQFKPALSATPTPTNQPSPTPRPESCIVTADYLNLRTCGGTACGVIDVLNEGDRLTILARGHWLKVQTEAGAAGFVNSNYCKIAEVQND